jgi:hypothetical protein
MHGCDGSLTVVVYENIVYEKPDYIHSVPK